MFAFMTLPVLAHIVTALNFQSGDVPGWIQLLPAGPIVEGEDGRNWRLSDVDDVVERFNWRGKDRPVDINHSTEIKGPEGEPAPAVGWIKELQNRNGELWARVEWTAEGRAAVTSKAYRYISPVFTYLTEALEITEITSAALTNNPNLKLTALNAAHPNPQSEETVMDKAILEALSLAQNATAADVVVAINTLKQDKATALNQAKTPDPEKFVPRADYDLALNQVKTFKEAEAERTKADIEEQVDAAIEAGKIAPASKDYHVAACQVEGGLEKFKSFVEAAPVIAAPSGKDGKVDGGAGASADKLSDEDRAVCSQLGLDPKEYAKSLAAEK